MDTTLNNNKNISDFCLKPLMKTKRHISLVRLHLLPTKKDSLLNFYLSVSKLRLCQPRLTRKIIRLPFFIARLGRYKTHFSFCRPGPFEKSPLMCRLGPLKKSPLLYRPVGKITPFVPVR